MATLNIADLTERFPGYRVAVVIGRALTVAAARDPAADAFVTAIETAASAEWGERPVSEIPEVQAWRRAYKGFGIRKTSYRPSVERLFRSLQRHGALPRVNCLVDLYNALSIKHRVPAGADDLDRVTPPLAFRFARPGDTFIALGDAEARNDPPKDGEVVYADAEKVLCRRWNWYQDARSPITPDTTAAVLTLQAIDTPACDRLEDAAAELMELMGAHCGGRMAAAVADRRTPEVTLSV